MQPKICLFLVDNSSYLKKSKGVKKSAAGKRPQKENEDVLSNKKYLRHSINRIQSENHEIGTCEITKISLSCFNYKIHILNNRFDGLVLSY